MEKHLISVESILKDKGKVILDDKKLELFLNGVKLKCSLDDGIYRVYSKNKAFIGTCEVKGKTLKRDVVM